MPIANWLWRLATICAVLLLPSWLYPKTFGTSDLGGWTQGWGWQNVASWAGVVAAIALFAGRNGRPRVAGSVLGALTAAFAFSGAAAETARTWIELSDTPASPIFYPRSGAYVVHVAPGMEPTFAIATLGAISALVLLGTWLRPDEPDR